MSVSNYALFGISLWGIKMSKQVCNYLIQIALNETKLILKIDTNE